MQKSEVNANKAKQLEVHNRLNPPHRIGQNEYVRWLKGEKLTMKEAMLANCYSCMGFFIDGKEDCKNELCPFYSRMVYKKIAN